MRGGDWDEHLNFLFLAVVVFTKGSYDVIFNNTVTKIQERASTPG